MSDNDVIVLVSVMLMVGGLLPIYLLPTIIASNRQHPNTAPIVVVNIFLGWTLIGYVVALAWSLSHIRR